MVRVDRAGEARGARRHGRSTELPRQEVDRRRPQVARGWSDRAALGGGGDALIEGFRPGVAERLGIGPEDAWASNPRLVYARGTGLRPGRSAGRRAGHDIDYAARRRRARTRSAGRASAAGPPLNLVADFGGGGMLLALVGGAPATRGRPSGRGQVVDAAMVDGAALLTTALHEMPAPWGLWVDERGANLARLGRALLRHLPLRRDRCSSWSERWNRSSSPSSVAPGPRRPRAPTNWIARSGRCCEPGSKRRSGGGTPTSGPSSPLTLTLASFPCSSSVRRRRTRSIASARRSPMSAARSSRHPPAVQPDPVRQSTAGTGTWRRHGWGVARCRVHVRRDRRAPRRRDHRLKVHGP